MGLAQKINQFFRDLFAHSGCEQCDWYRKQYEFQKGKIERLELALFPLATKAGAVYAAKTDGKPAVKKPFVKLDDGRPKTFAQIRTEWYAKQAEEMAADDRAAEEANSNQAVKEN